MGPAGAAVCLKSGANDLGGTLMNESISRAAGTQHGQEFPPHKMETLIRSIGREPMQRDTLYRPVPEDRRAASMIAADLEPIVLTPPRRKAGSRLGDAPLGQQRGHSKFVEQRAGTSAG
jgi:FO synthase